MRFIIQRVKNAKVEVNEKCVSKIGKGLLVLVGITQLDNKEIADIMINKLKSI